MIMGLQVRKTHFDLLALVAQFFECRRAFKSTHMIASVFVDVAWDYALWSVRAALREVDRHAAQSLTNFIDRTQSNRNEETTMQNATPLVSRRNLLTGIVAAPTLAAAAGATLAHAEDIDAAAARTKAALKSAKGTRLVLLGTGSGPIPGLARRMASNLMVHNEAAYVLDCGLGVTDQYARTGIPFSALRSIFITHHHPDHNIEYGPLLVIGWTSGMRQAVRAYGPPPLMQMTADYFRSAKPTIDFWERISVFPRCK